MQSRNVTGLNIAYIGGGSRGWAWNLMSDLAAEESLGGSVRLYDIDFDAALCNEKIGNSLSARDDAKGKWRYTAVRKIDEALAGADFVIISILPGTFTEMQSDVHLPEEYGIYQSVGDTVGPGGIIRALRTVPIFIEFSEQIGKYAPDSWVINYTNPMTVCTRTLYSRFPGIKAFGCCHEVFGTQELLAAMLMKTEGLENVARDEIAVNVLGINHFTWIDRASYRKSNIFGMYADLSSRFYEQGFEPEKGQWRKNTFSYAHRVKFDLFNRFDLIAAAGDRHLAEFVPGGWYLKDPKTIESWKFSITPVAWRMEDRRKRIERSERIQKGLEPFPLRKTGEEGVRQMKALLGMGDLVTNVNLPNSGQQAGLPAGAVVETNALFRRDDIRPVVAGTLPHNVRSLVTRHIHNQEGLLEAFLAEDRESLYAVFTNDPLVTISMDKSRELFERMIANTALYLPAWVTG